MMHTWEDAKIIIGALIAIPVISALLVGALFLGRSHAEASTESQIVEANYRIYCDGDTAFIKDLSGTAIKQFQMSRGGFWVYYVDGSADWLSSGVPCIIKEIEKIGNEFGD